MTLSITLAIPDLACGIVILRLGIACLVLLISNSAWSALSSVLSILLHLVPELEPDEEPILEKAAARDRGFSMGVKLSKVALTLCAPVCIRFDSLQREIH
jgi:hypothetical protein